MEAERIPRWESELWFLISNGDGKHCPLYSHCRIRQRGGWCADDNSEHLNWFDDKRFYFGSFDFIKSGTCYGEFKLLEMLAQRLLKEGRISGPPVPTELILLSDSQCPIEVRLLPLKTCHGAIWRLEEGWVIQLKEDDTAATRRFVLFHEAFHILAHGKTTPVFKKIGTDKGSFNELLADFFAAFLLMPEEWVKVKWAEVHDLNQMARIFDVPKPAMCVRLKRLGLI